MYDSRNYKVFKSYLYGIIYDSRNYGSSDIWSDVNMSILSNAYTRRDWRAESPISSIAQGIALGKRIQITNAPCKGNFKKQRNVRAALTGRVVRKCFIPRALPWAVESCPFGARCLLINAYIYHSKYRMSLYSLLRLQNYNEIWNWFCHKNIWATIKVKYVCC